MVTMMVVVVVAVVMNVVGFDCVVQQYDHAYPLVLLVRAACCHVLCRAACPLGASTVKLHALWTRRPSYLLPTQVPIYATTRCGYLLEHTF